MAKKWYVVQTYSGQENSVKEALERRVKSMNFEDKIYQVLSPEESYEETKKDGKKVVKTRKIYPGYLFIEFEVIDEVDDKAWFMVRNTPKVTGFLGSSGGGTKPVPVPKDEMDAILNKLGLIVKPKLEFNVGDKVRVISGPFIDREYEIARVNEEKETIIVLSELFGTTVENELAFNEIKKIA